MLERYQSICSRHGSYEVGRYLDDRVNQINHSDIQTIRELQKYMDNEKLKTIADYHDIISYQQGGKKKNKSFADKIGSMSKKINKGIAEVHKGIKKVNLIIESGEEFVEAIDKNPITRKLKELALTDPSIKKMHDKTGKNIKNIKKHISVVEKTIDQIPNSHKPKKIHKKALIDKPKKIHKKH